MFKKIMLSIMSVMILIAFTIPVFANRTNIYSTSTKANNSQQDFLDVTRPTRAETIYSKAYRICGSTDRSNVRVRILIQAWDRSKTKFMDYRDFVDDYDNVPKYWSIGSSGIFIHEIQFPKADTYVVRIVAYNKYDEKKFGEYDNDASDFTPGEDIQINDYKITVVKESVIDMISNGLQDFWDGLIN